MVLLGGSSATDAEPIGEISGAVALSRVEWGKTVPTDPVDVGTAVEQEFGCGLLTAVARTPEAAGDVLGRGGRIAGAGRLDAVEQAEGGGLPEAGVGPAFDEASRCVPLAECGGVSQGSSTGDDRAVRVDLGTGVEECVEDLDIITTRGPVQRGLAVGADETGTDCRSCSCRPPLRAACSKA